MRVKAAGSAERLDAHAGQRAEGLGDGEFCVLGEVVGVEGVDGFGDFVGGLGSAGGGDDDFGADLGDIEFEVEGGGVGFGQVTVGGDAGAMPGASAWMKYWPAPRVSKAYLPCGVGDGDQALLAAAGENGDAGMRNGAAGRVEHDAVSDAAAAGASDRTADSRKRVVSLIDASLPEGCMSVRGGGATRYRQVFGLAGVVR